MVYLGLLNVNSVSVCINMQKSDLETVNDMNKIMYAFFENVDKSDDTINSKLDRVLKKINFFPVCGLGDEVKEALSEKIRANIIITVNRNKAKENYHATF